MAAVGADDKHTVALWQWRNGKLLAHSHTHVLSAVPPQVYGIDWCPLEPRDGDEGRNTTDFITTGEGHMKFWKYTPWQAMEELGSRSKQENSDGKIPTWNSDVSHGLYLGKIPNTLQGLPCRSKLVTMAYVPQLQVRKGL